MASGASRFLFGSAAVLSGFGGVMHAAAFRKAVTAFAESNLPHFYAGSSKGLWLADSATLLILAVIFGVVAVWPSAASRSILMLVALIPAATAVLLYTFLGGFYAGHLLIVISALAFFGGLQLRVPQSVGASGQRLSIVSRVELMRFRRAALVPIWDNVFPANSLLRTVGWPKYQP